MKYLSALKDENPLNGELEKPKKPYHDELQKVQKPLFTVFAVQDSGTFQKKPEIEKDVHIPIRAKGLGCGACGNKIYSATIAWETYRLPETEPYEFEHRQVTAWMCETCKEVYPVIGGANGRLSLTGLNVNEG